MSRLHKSLTKIQNRGSSVREAMAKLRFGNNDPKKEDEKIKTKQCKRCGKQVSDLPDQIRFWCSSCLTYCEICFKKYAVYKQKNDKTHAKRCHDCMYLGDECIYQKVEEKKNQEKSSSAF